jgi:transcriptional regulator with XRE-family HTH domain
MTESSESPELSLMDLIEADPRAAQEMAAADLATSAVALVERALNLTGVQQKELARRLGITEGAVSQTLSGDGNMRLSTLAKYLRALGYKIQLTPKSVLESSPALLAAPSRMKPFNVAISSPQADVVEISRSRSSGESAPTRRTSRARSSRLGAAAASKRARNPSPAGWGGISPHPPSTPQVSVKIVVRKMDASPSMRSDRPMAWGQPLRKEL